MPDIDRLIEAWEIFRDSNPYEICDGREFRAIKEPEYCMGQMIKDTITILKEKESEAKWIYGEDKTGVDGWHCSECDFFEPWFYEFTDDIDFIRFYGHCPGCGRKMTSYTGKPTQTGG